MSFLAGNPKRMENIKHSKPKRTKESRSSIHHQLAGADCRGMDEEPEGLSQENRAEEIRKSKDAECRDTVGCDVDHVAEAESAAVVMVVDELHMDASVLAHVGQQLDPVVDAPRTRQCHPQVDAHVGDPVLVKPPDPRRSPLALQHPTHSRELDEDVLIPFGDLSGTAEQVVQAVDEVVGANIGHDEAPQEVLSEVALHQVYVGDDAEAHEELRIELGDVVHGICYATAAPKLLRDFARSRLDHFVGKETRTGEL